MLQSTGSQSWQKHDWATELNWTVVDQEVTWRLGLRKKWQHKCYWAKKWLEIGRSGSPLFTKVWFFRCKHIGEVKVKEWDPYTVEEKIQGELGEGGGLQMELLKGGSIWLGPRVSPGWDQVTALRIREMLEFLPVRQAVMWREMKIGVTNEQCISPNKAYKSLNVQSRPQHLINWFSSKIWPELSWGC